MIEQRELARIIYLADKHRVRVPTTLIRFMDFGDAISSISTHGLHNAIIRDDLPEEQFHQLYEDGQYTTLNNNPDPGSSEEFRLRLGRIIMESIDRSTKAGDLNFTDTVTLTQRVTEFITQTGNEMFASSEISLSEASDSEPFEKWDSGYEPFDLLFGGFYQGIFTILGKPGNGKTSIAWTLGEMARRSGAASSFWFFSIEIPEKMMLWKTSSSRNRFNFEEDDRLFCGDWSMAEILDKVAHNPDPNRIIIVDGPDAMTAGAGEGRRFAVEGVYRDLLTLKQNAKCVIATSQVRRNDDAITLESGSEAWQKAWYSDGMVGISKSGTVGQGLTQVRLNVVKNRFGPEGRSLVHYYNYSTLDWELPANQRTTAESWDTDSDW